MEPFVLEEATITQVHMAMKEGTLTCVELVTAYLQRIETYDKTNPPLNSIILVNPHAIEEAKRCDRIQKESGFIGPLHGIPVLLKDNCETKDMPTTAGSKSLEGWYSGRDATITKDFRKAGAIILAKTNLHEFAVWGETVSSILGQSYNPYDYTRTPGGSSGGTGAAISANLGMIGIGTDTINSIRSPASACSLCGIRPTIGLVSRFGIVPYSLTQDTAGPICRTVEDAVRTLDVISGYDPKDPITENCKGKIPESYQDFLREDGLKEKRIGILTGFFGKEAINQPVNQVMESALRALKTYGAELIELTEEFDSGDLVQNVSLHLHDLKHDLNGYFSSFGEHIPVHSISEILESGKYTPNIKENFETANMLSVDTPEYADRLQKREALQQRVIDLMNNHQLDALVYPHQQQLVCKAGSSQNQRNGVLGSVTGFPAITVPAGFSPITKEAPKGVPVGIEFLGRPFDESTLIEIAYGFEQHYEMRKEPLMN